MAINKTVFICVAIMIFGYAALQAETPLETFRTAAAEYEKGQFQEAVDLLESLVRSGQVNEAVLYNLGNAYYRTGQIGRAIANYELARRSAPRDEDLRHNLQFLRQQVQEPQPSLVQQVIDWFNGLVSMDELTILFLISYLLLMSGIGIYLFRKASGIFWVIAGSLTTTIFLGSWLAIKINQEGITRWAITETGPVEVRNGPNLTDSIGFTLPEGRKVILLSQKDDWAAIGLSVEGLKGWVEKKKLIYISSPTS